MSTIWGEENEIIEIDFPHKKFKKYLGMVGASCEDDLNLSLVKQVFLRAVADFKQGALDLDELSEIGGALLAVFQKKDFDSRCAHINLETALLAASELSFYVRHITGLKDSQFTSFMSDILGFYEKSGGPKLFPLELDWIIFAYRCKKNIPRILLLLDQKNNWKPLHFRATGFDDARLQLDTLLGLDTEDFCKNRHIDFCYSFSINHLGKHLWLQAAAAQIKTKVEVKLPVGYENMGWFTKEEVYNKLVRWKGYIRAFKKVFPENNTLWECVATERAPAQEV